VLTFYPFKPHDVTQNIQIGMPMNDPLINGGLENAYQILRLSLGSIRKHEMRGGWHPSRTYGTHRDIYEVKRVNSAK